MKKKVAKLVSMAVCLVLMTTSLYPVLAVNDAGFDVVSKDPNTGKLVYYQDSYGNKVPDYSYAGYRRGEVAIPTVNNYVLTVNPSGGDDTAAIQSAITSISARTPDSEGFRGVVKLSAGIFTITDPLTITKGGVVLRGAGAGKNGTIIKHIDTTVNCSESSVSITGSGYSAGSAINVTSLYVPVGSTTLTLASVSGLAVNDTILVKRNATNDWFNAIMCNFWIGDEQFNLRWIRKIKAINGNTITVDVPFMNAIGDNGTTGLVHKITDNRIYNCGVEDIAFVSSYNRSETYNGKYIDEDHPKTAITITDGVKDSWIRRCTAHFYWYAGFNITTASSAPTTENITVQDCAVFDPVSENNKGNAYGGSRAYSFCNNARLTLFQRCYSRGGRHDFVLNGAKEGGVFLDCLSDYSSLAIEPHQRWSHGVLFDTVKADQRFAFEYVPDPNLTHGQRAANSMFWNCYSATPVSNPWRTGDTSSNRATFHVDKPYNTLGDPHPTGDNWVVGSKANNFESNSGQEAYFRSMNTFVSPRSLYLQQLYDRKGGGAVNAVATWTQWAGSPEDNWQYLSDLYVAIPQFEDYATCTTWLQNSPDYEDTISNSIMYTAIEDSYVRSGDSAGVNYGTDTSLLVKNTSDARYRRQTYFIFSLGSLTGTIKSAKLLLYAADVEATGATLSIYPVSDDTWTETGITWNNKPSYGTSIAQKDISLDGQWYSIDITAYVKQEYSSDKKVSLCIDDPNVASKLLTFNSRECSTGAPRLVIDK